MTARTVRNRLLRSLPAEEQRVLLPQLRRVVLRKGEVVVPANTPLTEAWFPEGGLASVIAGSGQGRLQEVGLFGREGMGSPAVVLGAMQTPHHTVMQASGTWLRIEADALHAALRQMPGLNGLLHRYMHVFMVGLANTALSNGRQTIEERLARWLLMAHDRLDGDDLPLTHEFLSMMLGVRRSGVTTEIHILEGLHLIKANRARIHIQDREGLQKLAGDCYGMPEAEYERLIGIRFSK